MANVGTSSHQREITWTDDLARIFLNLFILEQEKESWLNKYLTKEGRTTVINSFKEATGYTLVWRSFKNHLTNQKTWYDCYNWLSNKTGVTIDHSTGQINMDKEWWDDRIKENSVAGRFRKKSLANQDLLEKVFSGTHIGAKDGWSVGSGQDVYRPQYGYDTEMEFNIGTTSQNENVDGSLPNMVNDQGDDLPYPTSSNNHPPRAGGNNKPNKRKRTASNIDNSSELSTVIRERSDAIKLAACEMSSALTSDITMASRRLHQISEIEFGSSFYWDATKLLSTDETVRRWLIGISENEHALRYLEHVVGRKHNE